MKNYTTQGFNAVLFWIQVTPDLINILHEACVKHNMRTFEKTVQHQIPDRSWYGPNHNC